MVYLDARSQCGSTHGSASDDTSSSMSTVVDRFSTFSDRVSTISTASTASTAGSEQQTSESVGDLLDRSSDRDVLLSRAICPLEHLERDFSNPPDYLLRRLANSEAVTHVESRGEVERITAVVAPNTVLIEETITLQPPLSFQDAPLSYGHEARPDLFYTADLAADSTTHFRPIKDDVELVERVNHEVFHEASHASGTERIDRSSSPPPLPARNHVNRISVNQTSEPASETQLFAAEGEFPEAPLLPPRPLPRKDVKVRRKRPPPPPPPPTITPRREVKLPAIESTESSQAEKENRDTPRVAESAEDLHAEERRELADSDARFDAEAETKRACIEDETDAAGSTENQRTNKILEIIEIRMTSCDQKEQDRTKESEKPSKTEKTRAEQSETRDATISRSKRNQSDNSSEIPIDESSDEEEKHTSESSQRERIRASDASKGASNAEASSVIDNRESEDDETYRSLDEINDDMRSPEMNRRMLEDEEMMEEEDTTDESDDGYYWQSNLATIGEEEEITSLEYVNA